MLRLSNDYISETERKGLVEGERIYRKREERFCSGLKKKKKGKKKDTAGSVLLDGNRKQCR